MSARKRAKLRAVPDVTASSRVVVIPPAAARRIREAQGAIQTALARATERANEIAATALEGMGLTTEQREDGLLWNVLDKEDGTMVAVFGPRMTSPPAEK